MSIAESAAQHMEELARNDYYGYSQFDRWNHNRDCSSGVIDSYDRAGLHLREHGASSTWDMIPVMLADGFEDVTGSVNLRTAAGMKRGDVAFKTGHVVMYLGNSLIGEATGDEFGGIGKGAQDGDQTGAEIWITPYRPDFNQVLRYVESEDAFVFELATISIGYIGDDIKLMQRLLRSRGFTDSNNRKIEIDGIFGMASESSLLKFQKAHGLQQDGICGPKTWDRLLFA